MNKGKISTNDLRKYLDKFPYDMPVTFIVDNARAEISDLCGNESPVIVLRTVIIAQDHIEAPIFDWDPPNPKDVA